MIFNLENAVENFVCKMKTILSQPKCVKDFGNMKTLLGNIISISNTEYRSTSELM